MTTHRDVKGKDANMDTVEVASIRSVHWNSHLFSGMIKSASRGREFYMNERTGAWLENQQHPDRSPSVVLRRRLLDCFYTHLSSADGFYGNRLITCLRAHIVMNSVEVAEIASVHGKRLRGAGSFT